MLRVTDDGRGGAEPALGSGLAGLAQRVRTVDGGVQSRARRAARPRSP